MRLQKSLHGINIFLVGMMGTGKTTVGKVLAQRLGYDFYDTDVLIEQVMQQSINDIFALEGEVKFRNIETQVLAELSTCTNSIIATGGGIVLKAQNWRYLRHGLIIWLNAPINLLVKRLAKDQTRPLLQETNLTLKLQSLLEERKSLYTQSNLRIMIEEEQTPHEISNQIFKAIFP